MAADDLFEQKPSRFVVGIDLGTTNSAVAYIDTERRPRRAEALSIPQLVAPWQIEPRDTLPSFHYQPPADEVASGALRLPWSVENPKYAVGFMARDWGAQTAGRVIASAKSWLCHTGVDRTADLLPWHGAADVDRLSPVEVSGRYLRHLRDAWNAAHRDAPLEEQDLVLTLPASFDEVARELTIAAAARAGLPRVTLIEEPQAAFYAWLHNHADTWETHVAPGQKILVCDVGGGTTDFTLIRVRRGEGGQVQFHRVAVGDHLILGGDNFDLALAQLLEPRLTNGGKIEPRQWDQLVRVSRGLKEQMLGDDPPPQATVSLATGGSKLIAGSLKAAVTREEVQAALVDGFLPRVVLDERPSLRRSGFQEFGLPYATDPAVTRYLAAFLSAHRHAGEEETQTGDHDPARPDLLLFNGGVFASTLLRERLLETLSAWFTPPGKPSWRPQVLENDRLDLAVARGAAYYGMVRRGEGVKISAGLARTYYLGVATDPPRAVCLMPGNAEPGREITLTEPKLELLVSQPAEFPLWVSSTRLTDRPGEIVPINPEQTHALPPIRTALKTRTRNERGAVPVQLHAKLTEIGTIDLWCSEVAGDRSWRLQFDVRSATQTDIAAHESAGELQGYFDESLWPPVIAALDGAFGPQGTAGPDGLMKRLAEAIGLSRDEWPASLLRRIWEALLEREAGRRKSPLHEARWLNLLGFALRPGYGLAVDDWRVAETWKTVQGKLAHSAATSRTESLILWRRIAGGFSAGQQRAIAEPLLAPVRLLHQRHTQGSKKGADAAFSPHESLEIFRLLGSLELLSGDVKRELGGMLLDLIPKKKLEPIRAALVWAVGRLGAREPLYGPLNTVLSPQIAGEWLDRLLRGEHTDAQTQFAVVQLARKTGDRFRDLDDDDRAAVVAWLDRVGGSIHAQTLVRDGGSLQSEERNRVFGESLPAGLRLA